MNSTFYRDGFRDGLRNVDGNPPDVSVYANEYWNGYRDAQESMVPFYKHEGANDMHENAFHCGMPI